jgi:hypothetical protein
MTQDPGTKEDPSPKEGYLPGLVGKHFAFACAHALAPLTTRLMLSLTLSKISCSVFAGISVPLIMLAAACVGAGLGTRADWCLRTHGFSERVRVGENLAAREEVG